jgi:hypothetical protein
METSAQICKPQHASSFFSLKDAQVLSLCNQNSIIFGGRWEQGESLDHDNLCHKAQKDFTRYFCLSKELQLRFQGKEKLVSAYGRYLPLFTSPFSPRHVIVSSSIKKAL